MTTLRYPNSLPTLVPQATTLDILVEEPGYAWRRQEPRWKLIENIVGGTLQMQQGGVTWLPQEPNESDASYANRLMQSVLPPYYSRMEQMLAGMLTRKPVRLEDVPDAINEHLFDVDLQGHDLNVWAYQFARVLFRYGHAGVLVDYGREDAAQTDRPYWCVYSPRDILGFRTARVDGTQRLTQLRLYEEITLPLPGSEWGEEVVQQVRVLEPGRFRLYQQRPSAGRGFQLVADDTTTLQEIPFAVAYANRTAQMESMPPLEEIAWLNLQAYRRSSDLANQLHLAAVPRLFLYGFPADLDEIEAGPESAIGAPVDARAEFAEPGGNSYQYQFQHLELIERQISQLGLAVIMGQQSFQESGYAKSIDRSQGDSVLMSVALQVQDLIDSCLDWHAQFLNLPAGGSSVVNRDFISSRLDPADVAQLLQLELNGKITQETLLQRLVDGDWLGELDVMAELEATQAAQAARFREQADRVGSALGNLSQQL